MDNIENYTKALTREEIEKIRNSKQYKRLLELEKHLDEIKNNLNTKHNDSIAEYNDTVPGWFATTGSSSTEDLGIKYD